MDKVFKALADPSRRQLLDRLFDANGQTLGDLCKDLDMSRQAVTQHLGVLEGANLIVTRWRGRQKLHYLNPVPIHELQKRWIRKFEQRRLDALAAAHFGVAQLEAGVLLAVRRDPRLVARRREGRARAAPGLRLRRQRDERREKKRLS